LGKKIDQSDLPALAELALAYYESLLASAEAVFVK